MITIGKEGVSFMTWSSFRAFIVQWTPILVCQEEDGLLVIEAIKEGVRFVYQTSEASEKADFASNFTASNVG